MSHLIMEIECLETDEKEVVENKLLKLANKINPTLFKNEEEEINNSKDEEEIEDSKEEEIENESKNDLQDPDEINKEIDKHNQEVDENISVKKFQF